MSPPPANRPLLLACEGVSRQFGERPLFRGLSFGLAEGDRVGLVGPNGSGKTTLLRLLAGLEEPDAGTRSVRKGVRIGYVAQDPELDAAASAEATVVAALGDLPLEEFERHARAARALGRLGFEDREQRVATLSGGWRKRLALARELAREPDVLLLDEPTNHLDLEGILELEDLLAAEPRAFVVVSHDRWFLEHVARRMLELDRVYPEGLLAVDGRYSDLLERRDEVRRNQEEYQETLANRARREVEWLRRGPKARTTKAKARVDAAHRLVGELAETRARTAAAGALGLELAGSGRRTRRLLEARGLVKSFGERCVLSGIDLRLGPGTRLGVLGPNGSGKTTLLGILAGTLAPDAGEIERADALRTVLFEQSRATLDLSLPLRRALAPEGDAVVHQGRELHVAAWAKRFLFRPEQLDTPVERLSGGERARILMARLMLKPADLLILDEPTNDLDIPSLEVLEESLLEFPGALVLVTHDRYLLDRVSTAILALDGRGRGRLFADLAQWREHRDVAAPRQRRDGDTAQQRRDADAARERAASLKPAAGAAPRPAAARKLGYREQREWEAIEAGIVAAEATLAARRRAAEDPAIHSDAAALTERYAALATAQEEVDRLYARWVELEALRG
jgi:ATP-binding cassette subfamily F protein uup